MSEHKYEHYEEQDEMEIDLAVLFCDIWKGFLKFWWVFLILCSLMAAVNYSRHTVTYTPMYESKASFTVSTQYNYDETNTSYSFYYNKSTAEQLEKLFPYILQTDVMQALIKEDLKTEVINGSIRAEAVPNSNLFTMKVTSSDRDAAKQILEAAIRHLPEVSKYVIGQTRLNMIQPPMVSLAAYNKPSYRKEVVKGAFYGVLLSAALLVAYALLRKTIKKMDDFQSVLNLKCFGVIPQVKFKAHNRKIDRSVSVRNEKTGMAFCEAIKSFSLKTERQMREKQMQTLLVTSTLPGEGKSMAALNLALTMGQRGKRVLLLDLDLRHPSLAQRLGLSEPIGVEAVLRGEASVREAMQEQEGILFLGAGQANQRVGSLLTRSALSELMTQAKQQAEIVIIDTPPCKTISDAANVAELCDGILYVIKQDTALRSQIIDGIQQVTSHGTPMFGGILNGAESSISGYGYGYGKYGYGYGYGYGKYGYGYGYGKYGRYGYGKYGYGKSGKQRKRGEQHDESKSED